MGADRAVHVNDEALHGSPARWPPPSAGRRIGTVEDGRTWCWPATRPPTDGGQAVPAMLAELLGVPALTHAREITVDGLRR